MTLPNSGYRFQSRLNVAQLQNGGCFRFQDGFRDYLAPGIHHRYRDRCLMNVEPNILFAVYLRVLLL
jgi:hypothetical protein